MTTIAWDGRYLAADTRGILGDSSLCQVPCHKLNVDGPVAFAVTGRITPAHRSALIRWWHEGADITKMPSLGAGDPHAGSFIMVVDGRCHALTYACPYPAEYGSPSGWGSGADYAIGCMEAGKTAMEAVTVAMKHDAHTGGAIEFIDTQRIEAGVQVWDGVMPSARFPMPVNDGLAAA